MSASLWDRCLSRLETELSEQQLNTWIRPLQAYEINSNLKIMAPNRFVLDMVKSNFYPRIQEIAASLDSKNSVTVDLVIGTGSVPVMPRGTPVDESAVEANTAPAPQQHSQIVSGKAPPRRSSGLNPLFTFDSLIEGKSNQLGRATAMQIGNDPGGAYNPFLIYGASGLGKTHLMQSIGHQILKNKPDARVLFLNSESYVAEMVAALQHSKMNQFKQFYRNLDALLIDDIQFFAGKEQTQEEFFHNFNALFEGGQQIVLTCDRYPKEVNGLADRLKTRFGWGLTIAVEPPELEMRVAILHSKAELAGFELPSEVSFFIAKRIRSNVRELEGALKRLIASARLTGEPISIESAKEALSDLLAVQAKLVTVENIQKTVAEYYKIRLADLSAKSRSRSIARPRQVAMALAKELTSKSLPEIGQSFGGRDHTTVMHACRKVVELKESDSGIREDYANLMRILTA